MCGLENSPSTRPLPLKYQGARGGTAMNIARLWRIAVGTVIAGFSAGVPVGCARGPVDTVREFNDAIDRSDVAAAREYLAPEARVWYENPTTEGEPWTLSGSSRYAAWDEHFHSHKTLVGDYQVDGPWVWGVFSETNDYYALTGRSWSRVYLAWRVNDGGRIDGLLVAAVGEPRSRVEEFKTWAREHEAAEYGYLFPSGHLDVTGDRAPRMHALLLKWRTSAGLGQP